MDNPISPINEWSKGLANLNITHWPELKVNFWGITKCASTTMKTHLYELHGGERDETYPINIHSLPLCYLTRKQAVENGFTNFAITRDPFARFSSAWKQLCVDRPMRGVQAGLKKGMSKLNLARWLSNKSDDQLDIHLRSQSWFIPEGTEIILMDLDSLDRDWKMDFPPPPYKLNVTNTKPVVGAAAPIIRSRYADDFERFGY